MRESPKFKWVPWVKNSPSRPPTTATAASAVPFDDHLPPPFSLKDVESLLHYPPLSPLHKHSLPFSPAHHHGPISFKNVHSLLSEAQSPSPPRKPSVFHRVWAWARRHPPDAENRVVVYYTSLRVVRRTYEDCRAVRSILKGYRVKIDERDLSMDGAFVDELQGIISGGVSLPMVFVKGKYVGGVEEIRRLHENGDLKRMIQGLPVAEKGVCGVCGGYRFVVCEWCDGSHRVFVEMIGFKSCSKCNVNGLIRCPCCTSVVF